MAVPTSENDARRKIPVATVAATSYGGFNAAHRTDDIRTAGLRWQIASGCAVSTAAVAIAAAGTTVSTARTIDAIEE